MATKKKPCSITFKFDDSPKSQSQGPRQSHQHHDVLRKEVAKKLF